MTLARLTIKNIVLIESLTIDFQSGLSALTGETGAGKSILLDSLGLALGARSESRLVRNGADKSSVTAQFDIGASHPVFNYIKTQDLDLDLDPNEQLILRRVLTADGRSRAYINDQSISAKMLQIIGAQLVEIHGQNDTHGLLDSTTHIQMLDSYANLESQLKNSWSNYKKLRNDLKNAKNNHERNKENEEFLRGAIEDIDAVSPNEGEEEELSILKDSLKHRQRILENLNAAYHALNNDDNDPIATASGFIARIADKIGEDGDAIFANLEQAVDSLNEARSAIETLNINLSESEHNLENIDDRLYELRKEARKHNCSVDQLIETRENLAQQLNAIEHADDILADLALKTEKAFAAYKNDAEKTSYARKNAALELDKKVAKELPPLKLGKATFTTHITQLPEDEWNENGMDNVEFLVSTNPGQAAGSIAKIASGGEMSRFMLALKVAMANSTTMHTMIFDEVDTGIGGGTSDAVGQRLALLGRNNQVLVVTHSPQVASKAHQHYTVEKQTTDSSTTTSINLLNSVEQKQHEIARMLSGETITSEAIAAAKSLLNTSTKTENAA